MCPMLATAMPSGGFLVCVKPSSFSESDVAEKSPCGRYVRFKKILGRGAFKHVYKGLALVDNVEIAWNQIFVQDEMTTTLTSDDQEINQEKLFSEAVLLRSLNHGNVMKCYSVWLDYDNKIVNMITELFTYGSVKQYIKKFAGGGSLDVQTIKNWGRQILHGLQYLHTQNRCIVHRDLKCDNIFVDVGKGEFKIGDFGLATAMDQRPLKDLVGTPKFMALEIYQGEYNELVDIYAFGMCLMEMATSEYPYSECSNQFRVAWKVHTGEKPAELGKVQDVELKEIIEKCLLPASSRPSAMDLLKDPFFSDGLIPMETEDNNSQKLTVYEYGEDQYIRLRSCCMDNLILSVISASFSSILDANNNRLQSIFPESSVSDVSMHSQVTYAYSRDLCFSVCNKL